MEPWIAFATFFTLLVLAGLLLPAFRHRLLRGARAGFYIVCLVAVMGWALLRGLVMAGAHRLRGR